MHRYMYLKADPIIRVYYDGFTAPASLEYRLFMAHGLGPLVCGEGGKDYPLQKNCVDPALSMPGPPNEFNNSGKPVLYGCTLYLLA